MSQPYSFTLDSDRYLLGPSFTKGLNLYSETKRKFPLSLIYIIKKYKMLFKIS